MSRDEQFNNLSTTGVLTLPVASLTETDAPVPQRGSILYNTDDSAVYVSRGPGIGWEAISSGIISTPVIITDTTPSTSPTTGALVVDGGVGIGKNMIIGGTNPSTSPTSGALVVAGGVGVGENLSVGGSLVLSGSTNISSTTQSTSCSTGALVVAGGVGIGENAFICGQLNVPNGTVSTSATTGAAIITGGLGVGGAAYIGGNLNAISGTASSSSATGALVVTGGVGIGGNVFVGSSSTGARVHITNQGIGTAGLALVVDTSASGTGVTAQFTSPSPLDDTLRLVNGGLTITPSTVFNVSGSTTVTLNARYGTAYFALTSDLAPGAVQMFIITNAMIVGDGGVGNTPSFVLFSVSYPASPSTTAFAVVNYYVPSVGGVVEVYVQNVGTVAGGSSGLGIALTMLVLN